MGNEDVKKEAGRPTKYLAAYAKQAEKLGKLGATDDDLANFFEVAVSTISLWKVKHKPFSEAVKRGKVIADMEVADRLYSRAVGYKFTETTKERGKGGKMITTKEVHKEQPPDTASAIFWLKNRQRDKWRDRIDHGLEISDNIVVTRPEDNDDGEDY